MVVPWVGGKRHLMPKILPLVPPHKTYVEAFGGGAALFFTKPPAEKTVLNDADPFIASFYRNFSCRAVEDCKKIRNVCAFAKEARDRVIEGSSDVCDQIAARRFTIVASVTSGLKTRECKFQPIVTRRLEKNCASFEERLRDAKITSTDFRDAFRKYDAPGTFTFLDPPYPGTSQPYRGDPRAVRPADVCALARKARGKVLITYNDIPEVRAVCTKGLHVKRVKSKHRAAHVQKASPDRWELLIANYPLKT